MTDVKRDDIELIHSSGLFDAEWYLQQYLDVKELGMNPVRHYLQYGLRLGRKGNPDPESQNRLLRLIGAETKFRLRSRPVIPEFARFMDHEPERCAYFEPQPKLAAFESWLRLNRQNRFREQSIRERIKTVGERWCFSIIMPVYNPPLDVLRDSVESVLQQSYQNFELILVDDRSTDVRVLPLLRDIVRENRNVSLIERAQNGHISAATNEGAEAATGDFLIFLDNDDALDSHALAIIASTIADAPFTDILYSDDAKFKTDQTALFDPKFKPDWSPELLLSYCYVSHVKVVRTSLFRAIGGCRSQVDGSQDHDLILRATEKTDKIVHIPQILYRRRALPGSTATSGHAKAYSFEAGRKACEEAFGRRGIACAVKQPSWAFERGLGVFVPVMPDNGSSVTILVPTRNNWRVLDRLLKSLKATRYRNYSVLIIDNESDDPETVDYLNNCGFKVLVVPSPNGRFNFAHLNNVAARAAEGEFLLFLNDDTEVIDPSWLSQMVGWAQLDGVGAVGARLLFKDGRIQHAGIVPSLPWRVGRTAFRGMPGRDYGYLMFAKVTRNCGAVTAACMLTRRTLFLEAGGFDEEQFGVAYNDVDYCLRLGALGKRVVYCAEAELYHHEGTSRGKVDAHSEIVGFESKYGRTNCPYFNRNLSRESNRFEIKPVVVPPVPTSRPIRVLGVSHNLRPEGAPNSAFEMLASLNADPLFDVSVCSLSDGPLGDVYRKRGIPLDILEREHTINANLADYDGFTRRIAARLRMRDYDVVYANTAELFWIIEAAKSAAVPSIWNIRESESWKNYYDRFGADVARRALSAFGLPYRTIFVAEGTRERWSVLDTKRTFDVIPNGIDVDRFRHRNDPVFREESRRTLGINSEDVMILCMGTVAPRKGQHELLLALEKIPQEIRQRAKVVIVGARESEYSSYMKKLATSLNVIDGAVQIVSETLDTDKYWAAADIFAFTSRLESYPRVILEAMAHGLPIVTTPTFGISEQVREGFNAFFYDPGDVDALAARIAILCTDAKKRWQMAEAGRSMLGSLIDYAEMSSRYKETFFGAAFSSVQV
jgi:GT2 family glycosyltransferase/glycosyltransferase involved in cell wall biosynthesis